MSHYDPCAHVRFASDDAGGILLDLDRGVYLSLNPTASLVWKALEKGLSTRQIVDSLAAKFEVDRHRATTDIARITEQLLERRLIAGSQ